MGAGMPGRLCLGLPRAKQAPAVDDELTDDAIAGHFRVLQRARGHRFSLDDVLTAREALRNGEPTRCLDLGCGIASVLLMLAYKLPHASFVGIEAQEISFSLAQRNVDRNGVRDRVALHLGDLREAWDALGRFELVTGTPPYMPPGTATPSPDPQKAHARVELRGGVEDYIAAGAARLAEGGRLVVCCDVRAEARVARAADVAGLAILRRCDAVPRAGHKGALFSVYTLGGAHREMERDTFVARDEDGGRTEAAHALRRFFDLPVNLNEKNSP